MRIPVLLSRPAARAILRSSCLGATLATLAACGTSGAETRAVAGGGGAPKAPADCTIEGDLSLEPGEGETTFTPLAVGSAPTLYHGAQGGTHMILALRITTPEPLDRYTVTVVPEVA